MYPGRTCLVLVLLSTLFPVLHEGMLLCSSTCFQSERSALLHAQSNRIKWPWTNSSKAGHQHKLWPVKQFLWYSSQQGKTKWSITDAHTQPSELKRPLTVMVSFHNSKSLSKAAQDHRETGPTTAEPTCARSTIQHLCHVHGCLLLSALLLSQATTS